MLGAENIDIVTGGGPGIMEAACKGHQDGRDCEETHSIGLNIDIPAEQKPNRYLDIKKDFHRFSKRLDTFTVLSNAFVVAPGGVGTLLEFVYTWQLIQVKHICNIPIILLGAMWKDFLKWVEKYPLNNNFLEEKDVLRIFLAKDSYDAYRIIKRFHEGYKKGEDICLNFKKYKVEMDSLLDGEKI
jgi:predicted Rossmann-fold nucleotide-binding protein